MYASRLRLVFTDRGLSLRRLLLLLANAAQKCTLARLHHVWRHPWALPAGLAWHLAQSKPEVVLENFH
jgi:hypothetical protein